MANDNPTTETVCWRLPAGLIDDLGPSGIREALERWRKSRRKLKPNEGETLRNTCYRMPAKLLDALAREADRLTDVTGTPWSIARVVREILRTAPRPTK